MFRYRIAIAISVFSCAVNSFASPPEREPSGPSSGKFSKDKERPRNATPVSRQSRSAPPIPIALPAKQLPEAVWTAYFAEHQDGAAPTASAVRDWVRQLMRRGEHAHVIALIHAALRSHQGQPWMFEALGLAMQADNRSPAEIERALMSALDFTSNPTDILYLAQYLERAGLPQRALQLYSQVCDLAPDAPEAFVQGLRLAQRLDDVPSIQWATLGVLSRPWPKRQAEIAKEAYRVAEATLDHLRSERRKQEAQAYLAALDEAVIRECVVVVRWLGSADVDLSVEEPTGTICSYRNLRTAAGGVLLGDSTAAKRQGDAEAASEVYVCARGFKGRYCAHVQRVIGKVVANKISMDVYWHFLSNQARTESKHLELVDGKAYAEFELDDGRRTDSLADHEIAHAVAGQ